MISSRKPDLVLSGRRYMSFEKVNKFKYLSVNINSIMMTINMHEEIKMKEYQTGIHVISA